MRLLLIAIVLGLASPVVAEPQVIDEEAERTGEAVAPTNRAIETSDTERTGSSVHPTQLMRERQRLEEAGEGGRSGFWTSRQPAKGGAYRYRLLLIGIGLIGLTGAAIVFLLKRANRSNKSRPDPWASWVAKMKTRQTTDAKPAEDAKPTHAENKPDDETDRV